MQINIRDLMDNIEDSSVDLEEKDVVSSERIKELTKMKINEYGFTEKKHSSKKKFLTVMVAAAVISAVGISTYAAFKGGLEGVSFGDPTEPSGSTTTERIEVPVGPEGPATDGGYSYQEPPMNHLISLQGYSDTNEFKASKEWREFEDGYDKDWKICDAYDKECKKTKKDPFEEKYPGYGIYSKEMADKVDELIKKYNLKLRGKFVDGKYCEDKDDKTIHEKDLIDMFGNIWDDKIKGAGYCYENGTFSLDADYEKVSFQIRRVIKGTFDTVYLNVGDISQYKQWTYKTKCGVEVAIALQDYNGVVLANTPKGFVAINLCQSEDEFGTPLKYTKEQIEEFVDHINFNNL